MGKYTLAWALTIAAIQIMTVCADPVPSDVYREYLWWNEDGNAPELLKYHKPFRNY
ncbi:MAG: hypothetical protein P9L94_03740 [Candidatus Hinthialibacter antarcticus]|nr:hypothetical protein [Candidatus Hinthialibacter antarcticus]